MYANAIVIGCAAKLMSINAVAHQVGTLRSGVDPQRSVFDPTCRSHEFDNLYVADALRVAEILRYRLGAA